MASASRAASAGDSAAQNFSKAASTLGAGARCVVAAGKAKTAISAMKERAKRGVIMTPSIKQSPAGFRRVLWGRLFNLRPIGNRPIAGVDNRFATRQATTRARLRTRGAIEVLNRFGDFLPETAPSRSRLSIGRCKRVGSFPKTVKHPCDRGYTRTGMLEFTVCPVS
jgi:hypothetical protein